MKASDYEKAFEARPGRTAFRVGTMVVLGMFGLSAIGWSLGLVTLPFRSARGVVERTLAPDNIIHNYEWFYDTSKAFEARSAQIISYKADMVTAVDSEKSKMRIELQAMRQVCRDLAARYNANSEKANRSIFMGGGVPNQLDPTICEA